MVVFMQLNKHLEYCVFFLPYESLYVLHSYINRTLKKSLMIAT